MHVPQKEISLDDLGTGSSLKPGIPSSGPLGTQLDDEVDLDDVEKGAVDIEVASKEVGTPRDLGIPNLPLFFLVSLFSRPFAISRGNLLH